MTFVDDADPAALATVGFLPTRESTTLEVVDVAGRRLAVLATGSHTASAHTARWHGRDSRGRTVASGTYFVLLRGEDAVASRKVTLIR
ncbi:MAG: hypothetical protein GY838_01275 [bacterium]|nr:hypothetical protein [bacterium]